MKFVKDSPSEVVISELLSFQAEERGENRKFKDFARIWQENRLLKY